MERIHRTIALFGAAVVAVASGMLMTVAPAGAAALTNPGWAVSNSQTSAAAVSYTYQPKASPDALRRPIRVGAGAR
jgi:hypothetical protein